MFKHGDMVSVYKIVKPLSKGGFSQIYKALDPQGKLVILKFPDPSLIGDLATYERYRREFAIGQKLNHPAIPRAIARVESPEGEFLVLEYVEGKSLRAFIGEKAPLPLYILIFVASVIKGSSFRIAPFIRFVNFCSYVRQSRFFCSLLFVLVKQEFFYVL